MQLWPTTSFLLLPHQQVLDPEEADVLLRLLTLHLPTWSPGQLAAALSSTLPCLGDHAPSDGQSLALLFDAAGAAAAAGMDAQEAGQLLLVLAQLPGYAPDAKVTSSQLSYFPLSGPTLAFHASAVTLT